MSTAIDILPTPSALKKEEQHERHYASSCSCCVAIEKRGCTSACCSKWLMDYHLPVGLILFSILGYLWPTPGKKIFIRCLYYIQIYIMYIYVYI